MMRESGMDGVFVWGLRLVLALVLAVQASSLFVLPIANSDRWRDDESWLLTEYKQQLTTGVARFPQAYGATISESKGILIGVVWCEAALYGVPMLALKSASHVDVGRVVTFVQALAILLLLLWAAKRLRVRPEYALGVAILMVTNTLWLYPAHSARPDISTGLIVLGFIAILETSQRVRPAEWSSQGWFLYGFFALFFSLTFSIHVISYFGPYSIYLLIRSRIWSRPAALGAAVGGVAACAVLLALSYYAGAGSFELFHESRVGGPFATQTSVIPIMRPFSRSVQISNVVQRVEQLLLDAPAALYALLAILGLWLLISRRVHSRDLDQPLRVRAILMAAIALICWFEFESAGSYYFVHCWPLVCLGLAVLLDEVALCVRRKLILLMPLAIAVLVASALHVTLISKEASVARRITQDNRRNVQAAKAALFQVWKGPVKPFVFAETPAHAALLQDDNVRIMTEHLYGYGDAQPHNAKHLLDSLGVDYALFYTTPHYQSDSAVKVRTMNEIVDGAELLGSWPGYNFDMNRSYREQPSFMDTLKLYRLKPEPR